MNHLVIFTLVNLCLLTQSHPWGEPEHDGSWKGEGLAESQDNGQWNVEHKPVWGVSHYAPQHKWNPAPLGHDGRVVDTPEVAEAKAAHLAALEHARASAPAHEEWKPAPTWSHAPAWTPEPKWSPAPEPHYAHAPEPKWTGPPAHIELTHDGKNLKDTPEVAHAKAAHLAAIAAVAAKSHAHAPAYPHGLW